MTKRHSGKDDSFEVLGLEVPAAGELVPLEPVLESLSDLASRRDMLRLMAERAKAEAEKLDEELRRQFDSHERQLRALAAQQGLGGHR